MLRALLFNLYLSAVVFPGIAFGLQVSTLQDEEDIVANDGAGISLREAIRDTEIGNSITFAPALSGQTIELILGEIVFPQASVLTVDASSLDSAVKIDAGGKSRIFRTQEASRITLRSLVLVNGVSTEGGAILNGESLELQQCVFEDNMAEEGNGGAVSSSGDLIISECFFTRNSASPITTPVTSKGHGGGIFCSGALIINRSTFAYNQAEDGGGISSGGSTTITNSTFYQNIAIDDGGAIANRSEGLTIKHATIVANRSDRGRGIASSRETRHIVMLNTIVSGNGRNQSAVSGQLTDSSRNNLIGIPAFIAPLGDYGGFTPTAPPLTGSPAINAGGNTDITEDQRGEPRLVGEQADIGAVESNPATNLIPEVIAEPVVRNKNDSLNIDNISPEFLSLREAIAFAALGSTVRFDESLAGETITLELGEIVLARSLNLNGAHSTGSITLSGAGKNRLFRILSGVNVSLQNLIVEDGFSSDPGGAIFNNGSLNLSRCVLQNCQAGGSGGACFNNGQLFIDQCSVTGNRASSGAGVASIRYGTIKNSLFHANQAEFVGGALSLSGGFFNMTSSTLIGNESSLEGGGVYLNNGIYQIQGCTIVENSASDTGGGIYNRATLALLNSIVSQNVAPDSADVSGVDSEGNLTGADPLLAELGDYGGPTLSMPPLESSPALDQAVTSVSPTDQRGFLRSPGGSHDLGAVERNALDPGTQPSLNNPVVTTAEDELDLELSATMNDLSLREALAYSAPDAEITFHSSLSGQTITLGGLPFVIPGSRKVSIDASTLSAPVRIDAARASRLFQLEPQAQLTLSSLDLYNGKTPFEGGAILNQGQLALTNVTLFSNEAEEAGGGIYCDRGSEFQASGLTMLDNQTGDEGGAIASLSPATIMSANFSSNTSVLGGGAIHSHAFLQVTDSQFEQNRSTDLIGNGGAIWSGKEAQISRSIFRENQSAGDGGAIMIDDGKLILTDCFLEENKATKEGGAIYLSFADSGIFLRSTLSQNTANAGGGIYAERVAKLNVRRCTLVVNDAITADGGAIFVDERSTTEIAHCTFVRNSALGQGNAFASLGLLNLTGSIVVGTEDIISRNTYVYESFENYTETNNYFIGDALLLPLGDYGGPTPTMPPLPNSPVIGQAISSMIPSTDQRGFALPTEQALDLGAVQRQTMQIEVRNSFTNDSDADGVSDGLEFTVGRNPFSHEAFSLMTMGQNRDLRLNFNPESAAISILQITSSTDLMTFNEVVFTNEIEPIEPPGEGQLLSITPSSLPKGPIFYRLEAIQRGE